MNEKEFIKRIGICVLLVLLCAFAVYFIIGTRKDVHNNGQGANAVRNELRNIEETQRTERKSLNETEKSINRGINRVEESKQANREIASVERADAEIIAECQSILARVRKRTATED